MRFAIATPLMYRLATVTQPEGELDETMASAAFAHLHNGVKELVTEGLYPEGDTVAMALQLWVAAHGVASMLVTKPHLPWGIPRNSPARYCVRRAWGRRSAILT